MNAPYPRFTLCLAAIALLALVACNKDKSTDPAPKQSTPLPSAAPTAAGSGTPGLDTRAFKRVECKKGSPLMESPPQVTYNGPTVEAALKSYLEIHEESAPPFSRFTNLHTSDKEAGDYVAMDGQRVIDRIQVDARTDGKPGYYVSADEVCVGEK